MFKHYNAINIFCNGYLNGILKSNKN